jgi:hypothetical protein
MKTSPNVSKQNGASLTGILIIGALLAYLGVVGAQVVPTYMEFQSVLSLSKKVAAQGVSVPETRANFDKATQIDSIKSITAKELDVTKVGEKTVVAFAYTKEIHLFGPAYILLKYAGSSDK